MILPLLIQEKMKVWKREYRDIWGRHHGSWGEYRDILGRHRGSRGEYRDIWGQLCGKSD